MGTARRLRAALLTPLGLLAAAGFGVLLVLAVAAPMLWGVPAATSDPMVISRPPMPGHPLGTDAGGRDILLRTLVATRLSVMMALAATALGVGLGIVLGLLPLLAGGWVGRAVLGLVNIAVAFPGMLMAISLSVILGQSGVSATIAIGLSISPGYARLVNNLATSVWGNDFVSAARVLGVPRLLVLTRHVLPNVRDPLVVNASMTAGGCLLAFAGLSFLGLGVQPPEWDWGQMLFDGVSRIFVSPAAALAPGVAIIVSGMIFTLLGEVLSKALTPGSDQSVSSRVRRLLLSAPAAPSTDSDSTATDSTGSTGNTDSTDNTAQVGSSGDRAVAGVVHEVDDPILSVRDLQVRSPGATDWTSLVDGVSFDIGRGEVVGLVGESGSGKSLTLMSTAGLVEEPLHVQASAATFDGEPLPVRAGGPEARLAHRLGARLAMVFQDPMSSLNPALTVGSQVAEVGLLHLGLNAAAARKRVLEVFEAVQLADPQKCYRQYPHELSGGMRQRVMIAMGLMGSPSLLLADEPTTALDVTVQAEVLDLLRSVNARGTAVVLVSHDIAVVTSICTRVLVMYRGQLVESIDTVDLVAGRAQHRYTRALLATVPTMQSPRGEPLASIGDSANFDAAPVAGPQIGQGA